MYLKYLTLILFCFSITSITLAQCPNSDISLSSQADIDNFPTNYPGCTMIPAGVNVSISNGFAASVTNLNGLSSLNSIGGNLDISSESLPNLVGLSGLTSIGGYLNIATFDDSLISLDGISNLTSIGGTLSIEFNDALTNIDGLSGLTTIGGNLFLFINSALVNLDGLSSLTHVGGLLEIDGNFSLTNVDGLSALTSIGGNLLIRNNPELTMCCALCPILQADANDDTVIGGTVDISSNAAGCDEASILTCTSCMLCDLAVDGQPTSQTTCSGEDVNFTLTISGGTAPLSYQLQSDCTGTFIDVGVASTSPIVTISSASAADACNYQIVVTDSDGCATTSDMVTLTIDSCPDPEIIPTVSEWGLIMLSLIMLIIGVVSIREQRVVETSA